MCNECKLWQLKIKNVGGRRAGRLAGPMARHVDVHVLVLYPATESHVWVNGPDAAGSHDDVHGPCYRLRSSRCWPSIYHLLKLCHYPQGTVLMGTACATIWGSCRYLWSIYDLCCCLMPCWCLWPMLPQRPGGGPWSVLILEIIQMFSVHAVARNHVETQNPWSCCFWRARKLNL